MRDRDCVINGNENGRSSKIAIYPTLVVQQYRQEALLLQRERARHLSVEILQLQNFSLENPIMWHYLRDSAFSRYDTIPECDRHTEKDGQTHDDGIPHLAYRRAVKIDHIAHPPIIITTAGNERRSIAKCTVIIRYLNDNAQTPLNRFTIYMLYSHLCNKYSENRTDGAYALVYRTYIVDRRR